MYHNLNVAVAHLICAVADLPEGEDRERWERAIRYGKDATIRDDATSMLWELHDAAGSYVLAALDEAKVEEEITDWFTVPDDELEWLDGTIRDITAHVGREFNLDGCAWDGINDWIRAEFKERAKQDGVAIKE